MKIWLVSILLAAVCSVNPALTEECIDLSKKDPTAVCTDLYKPVCGCNKLTYGNACEAKRKGVQHWTEGACDCVDESKKPTGFCTKHLAPVCGCNGVTYDNACMAEHAGVTSWTEGECEK